MNYTSNNFYIVLFLALLSWSETSAQADTTKYNTDSLSDQITINHYIGTRSMSSLGYYAVNVQPSRQTLSGVPVQNTLRGQVPGLLNDSYVLATNLTIRNATPSYVIDGIAYSDKITSAYNMNAFEYQSVSVINSGAVATALGGSVNSGLVLLTSKTGENYNKPTIEYAGYTTLTLKPENVNLYGAREYWRFTNAVAYMQDFGQIDLRASYSYTANPDRTKYGDVNKNPINTFRINTGLDLDKFKARLILDDYIVRHTGANDHTDYGYKLSSKQNTLQGNLVLTYQLLPWLKLSAQGSISRFKNDYHSDSHSLLNQGGYSITQERDHENQHRKFVNAFLSVNKKFSDKLAITAFAGAQREKYQPTSNDWYHTEIGPSMSTSGSSQQVDIRNNSYIGGVGLQLFQYWFFDYNYRQDHYTYVDNFKNSKNASAAFLFGDAFHWTTKNFSFGKLRIVHSSSDVINNTNYPYNMSTDASHIPTGGQRLEFGMDLGFLNNRVMISTNRFQDNTDHYYAIGYYDPPYIIDHGKGTAKGWETSVGVVSINKQNLQLSTKLTWYAMKGYTEQTGNWYWTDNARWHGTFLNQLTWTNFFVNVLITRRTGGARDIYLHDGAMTQLRDVTMGYTTTDAFHKIGIRSATISVSGRNLWQSHVISTWAPYAWDISYRTISGSISCTF